MHSEVRVTDPVDELEYTAGDPSLSLNLAQIENLFQLDQEHQQTCGEFAFTYTTVA